jgi:hypothetical protein
MAKQQPNGTNGTASRRTTLGVSAETHARVVRLARLHGKPAAWLIHKFASVFERKWHGRMSADEWSRYLKDDISPYEAQRIMARDDGLDDGKRQIPEPFVFDNA